MMNFRDEFREALSNWDVEQGFASASNEDFNITIMKMPNGWDFSIEPKQGVFVDELAVGAFGDRKAFAKHVEVKAVKDKNINNLLKALKFPIIDKKRLALMKQK